MKNRVLVALSAAAAAAFLSLSARAEIAEEPLLNPDDSTDVWGKKITGLGENGDETALVFTKTGATMNWTLEKGVNSIWYLVAGGGGSGGASSGNKYYCSGGGGAGGLLESKDVEISSQQIAVLVGAGGDAVVAVGTSAGESGKNGGNSELRIGSDDPVVAYGGGGGSKANSPGGADGGSGGGAGAGWGTDKNNYNYPYGQGVDGQGNNGGTAKRQAGAGGGGGAGGKGESTSSGSTVLKTAGGAGGAGKSSVILGNETWYCAGGGGGGYTGSGGAGGSGVGGAGSKQTKTKNTVAGSGTTYGCGGGGTCGLPDTDTTQTHTSGAGYQGVVIVRYKVLAANVVEVPTIEGVDYNGMLQKAVVPASDGYTVTKNDGGVDAGDYDVVLTLVDGYTWYGGSTEATNLTFTISKIANGWQREPSLSKGEWQYLDEAATVDCGLSLLDEAATVTYDEGETTMPETVGPHTAVFTVAESANYKALSKTIPYTIKPRTNTWVTEPSITPTKWAFDETPGMVDCGEAESGGEVVVTYDGGLTEMPSGLGEHTAVFTVAASENYTAITKTIPFEITKKVNGWTSAPVVEPTRYTPGALPTFTPPTAKFGEVVCYFDGDPANTEVPTSLGKHMVTYAVAEGDDYQAFEQTIELTVLDNATLGVAQVVITGYDGAAKLTNFPALVRFSAANVEGLNADLLSEDGSDVRVYGEDGNELAFEIESWNRTGESIIWVKIPELAPVSEKTTSVFVKWGATEARMTDPKDVWTAYLAVWHMNGTTIVDATGNGNVLTGTSVTLTDGEVGKALAASKGLAMSENFVDDCPDYAVSCWYRYGSAAQVTPLSKGKYQGNGWFLEYKNSTTEMNYFVNASKSSVKTPNMLDNWNHVAVNVVGGALTGYMNGTTKNTHTKTVSVDDYKLSALGSNGSGKIDELRIHKGGESAAWAKADYCAQTGALVSYALVQNPEFEDVIVVPAETPPVVDDERNMTIGYRVSSTGGSTVTVSALYAIEGADTTNETVIGSSSVVQTEDAFGTIEDLMPGTNYLVAVYGENASGVTSEPTAWQQVTVPGPVTIEDVELSQTKDETTITGVITGLGTKSAKLRYAFGKDEFAEIDLDLDDDGAFSVTLDRTSATDTLKYQVVADNTLSTTTWGDFAWNAETKVETSTDGAPVTYTWTGGASGEWADPANWKASVASSYGYPNSKDYATAKFTQAATVDLGGGTFGLVAEGLKVNANLGEVTLCNGKIDVPPKDFGYGVNGTTVIFDNVTITGQKGLNFVAGATVVFEGSTAQGWSYEPWDISNASTTLKIRNGLMSSGYFQVYLRDTHDHRVYIDNAVWTLNNANKSTGQLATKYYLTDGADRQAQLVNENTSFSLTGTWYIPIPAEGHKKASIVGKTAANAGGTFQLELKDWVRGKRVPLVTYTGAKQTTVIQGLLDKGSLRLSLLNDGKSLSDKEAASRNGHLEWDEATNTLYYKQDGQFGMMIYVK